MSFDAQIAQGNESPFEEILHTARVWRTDGWIGRTDGRTATPWIRRLFAMQHAVKAATTT